MAFFATAQNSAGHVPDDPVDQTLRSDTEVPLDYLVNALNRAVVRKQSAATEETEYRR